MKVAIYTRVSSQRQRDAHTIESQLRVLPEYARAQGWAIVETYVDDGKSAAAGKLEARDAFARLLADADARRFEVVLVVDLDRLSRSEDLAERGAIYGRLQRAGVQIATPSLGIVDARTFLGDVTIALYAAVAAEENRKRRERTVQGKLTAIGRGWKPSGPTPYGWVYDRATHTWSVHAERAAVLVSLYEGARAGKGCHALAEDLNERGVPAARGGTWTAARVYDLITSTAARGVYLADKRRGLTVPVPRIVSDELWQAAVDAIRQRRTARTPRTPRGVALCQGLATCACGSRVWVSTSGSGRHGGGPRYYTCCRRLWRDRAIDRCEVRPQRVEVVDERVWAAVADLLRRPDLLAAGLAERRARSGAARVDWAAEERAWQRKLDRLERVEAEILARYRRGAISSGALDRELEAAARERALLTRQRDVAREQAARATREEDAAGDLIQSASALQRLAERASPTERQDLLRRLLSVDSCGVTLGGPDPIVVRLLDPAAVLTTSRAGSVSVRTKHLKFKVVAWQAATSMPLLAQPRCLPVTGCARFAVCNRVERPWQGVRLVVDRQPTTRF